MGTSSSASRRTRTRMRARPASSRARSSRDVWCAGTTTSRRVSGVTLVLREAVPGSAGIMRGQIPGDVYETTIAHTPNTRTSDRSGTLRLVRSGQTVSSYYLRDGRWVRLASGEASTTDVAFELTLWTDDAARTGLRWRESGTSAPVAVALDDFRLTAATLVCP